MLAEFVRTIAEMAKDKHDFQIEDRSDMRKVFVRFGENLTLHDYLPEERAAVLKGFADFVAAVQDKNVCVDPEVYHAADCVQAFVNRAQRDQSVSMNLNRSERFQKLTDLKSRDSMSIRDVVHMLRFDLHGTGSDAVLASLQKVDFTRRSDGKSSIEHGKESLGRSVEAAVQQADGVPKEFKVTVPVYTNPGLRDLSTVDVRCGIYLDVQEETVRIRPLADELEAATNKAQVALGEALRADLGAEVPVFHGAP